MDSPPVRRRHAWIPVALVALLLLGFAVALLRRGAGRPPAAPDEAPVPEGLDVALMRERCSACHLFPEPSTLPRWAWRNAIPDMYAILDLKEELPPDKVLEWYVKRAPESFPLARQEPGAGPGDLRLERHPYAPAGVYRHHAVSNVRLLDLRGDGRLEMIVTDMTNGKVLVGEPYRRDGKLEIIASIPNPAHSEVVDLDRDGRRDLVVANLGSVTPADHHKGSVVWLRAMPDGTFRNILLMGDLGRVADVQPADFDGDGDIDLAVAEFGWRTAGRVLLLENRTTDWSRPEFALHELDSRHGSIHVPVTDLNGDGRPDLLALISQEHETIAAYVNLGGLQFESHDLFRAPSPTWGSSGLSLADLDGDGDLDLISTNGDSFDNTGPKPYHGVQWFENRGGLSFVPREHLNLFGAYRAEAADLDGDGDLDLIACSLIYAAPGSNPPPLDGVTWFEQDAPGHFVRHPLEVGLPDHATLSVGDYDLDGDVDVAIGNFVFPGPGTPRPDWVVLWENRLH